MASGDLDAVVVAQGSAREAERARLDWTRAAARGEPESQFDAPVIWSDGDHEILVVAVCSAARAAAVAAALSRTRPLVRTVKASGRSGPPCPRLVAAPAAPRTGGGARVPLCELDRRERTRRHGDDALCLALWDTPCASGPELPSARDRDPCPRWVGTGGQLLATVERDGGRLWACRDGDLAWWFTTVGGELRPVDVWCERGPDHATAWGALRVVGMAACLESVRLVEGVPPEPFLRCVSATPDFRVEEIAVPERRYRVLGGALCLEGPPREVRFDAAGVQVVPVERCRGTEWRIAADQP